MREYVKTKYFAGFVLLVTTICFIFYFIVEVCRIALLNLHAELFTILSLFMILGTVVCLFLNLKKVKLINKYNTYPNTGKTVGIFIIIMFSIIYITLLNTIVQWPPNYNRDTIFTIIILILIITTLFCIAIHSGEGVLPNSVRNPKPKTVYTPSTKDNLINMRALRKVLREEAIKYKKDNNL